MSYTYKTQANVNRSDIDIPGLNYNFEVITIPDFMVEDCLRVTPKGYTNRRGAKATTFQDVCQIITLYLSGVKQQEIQRILGKGNAIVSKYVKYAAPNVKGKELHAENRMRNMLGKELAKVEDYMND